MKRRHFLFWTSLGLFQLGETLGIESLDRAAAATINLRRRRAPSRPVNTQPTTRTVVETTSVETSSPAPTSAPVEVADAGEPGSPDPQRRARHGRPPSKWLRSLEAEELRVWLATIDPPAAGVSGMTYWTHLTRDHSFDPAKIEGLTIDEQAKLHAAAHDGY
jgi:hypothetical protein